MQRRGFRLTLLTLLIGAAVVGGLIVWSAQQRIAILNSSERDEVARINQIAELVAALGSVQLAYSASPQTNDGWFGHVTRLVEAIETETAALWQKSSRSDEPPLHLRAFLNATGVVAQATARAKENLVAGGELMAVDLVLGETRQSVDAMAASLGTLQADRRATFANARTALEQRSWTVIGAITGLWTLGLLTLTLARPTQQGSSAPAEKRTIAPYPEPQPPLVPVPPVMDLSEAAALCTAISRVTSANQLPGLLARTATLIDASGIILWTPVGGESLTATASYGYEPGLINRISPIPLSVSNPTTAAWHAGSIRTVPPSSDSTAAIAAPMLGTEGCVGVLAAEMRHGAEVETASQSIVMIVAAQFASIIAAPSASERADVLMSSGLDSQLSDLPLKVAGV